MYEATKSKRRLMGKAAVKGGGGRPGALARIGFNMGHARLQDTARQQVLEIERFLHREHGIDVATSRPRKRMAGDAVLRPDLLATASQKSELPQPNLGRNGRKLLRQSLWAQAGESESELEAEMELGSSWTKEPVLAADAVAAFAETWSVVDSNATGAVTCDQLVQILLCAPPPLGLHHPFGLQGSTDDGNGEAQRPEAQRLVDYLILVGSQPSCVPGSPPQASHQHGPPPSSELLRFGPVVDALSRLSSEKRVAALEHAKIGNFTYSSSPTSLTVGGNAFKTRRPLSSDALRQPNAACERSSAPHCSSPTGDALNALTPRSGSRAAQRSFLSNLESQVYSLQPPAAANVALRTPEGRRGRIGELSWREAASRRATPNLIQSLEPPAPAEAFIQSLDAPAAPAVGMAVGVHEPQPPSRPTPTSPRVPTTHALAATPPEPLPQPSRLPPPSSYPGPSSSAVPVAPAPSAASAAAPPSTSLSTASTGDDGDASMLCRAKEILSRA